MRYQIDEKTTTMNYRYICPQTILGVYMQNYKLKCSLELEMPNMQVASTK